MKHNLKVNKAIRYLEITLLISIIVFSSVAATVPAAISSKSISEVTISKYIDAQQNPVLSDEEKIKAAIDAYFTTRYEGQKLLAAQDFSPLLEDSTLAWVNKEKDKREIELYNASLFDLKYLSYIYTLNYDSIEIKNNKATVQLRENHAVVFESIAPDVSELFNLQHIFTLHNKKGEWVIYKDEYQDELSEELTQLNKEEIKKIVDRNYIDDVNQRSQKPNAANVLTSPLTIVPMLATHAYSAAKATAYADAHVVNGCTPAGCNYNTTYYASLSQDCADFVSQALYAGEGKSPPDTSGMTTVNRNSMSDWYYDYPTKTGSAPWVGVRAQYDFIRLNLGGSKIGPYGVIVAFAGATAGDPVYISQSASFDHEGIIITKTSSLSTTTIDAHTNDRRHYPLSQWATYTPIYIHIQGWQN